jgi:hypothetical protein
VPSTYDTGSLVLFYAPNDGPGGAGYVEFDLFGADKSITRLDHGTYDALRSSWTKIAAGLSVHISKLEIIGGLVLFYAPHDGANGAGLGEIYSVTGDGQMWLLKSYDGWRSLWDIIEMIPSVPEAFCCCTILMEALRVVAMARFTMSISTAG